MKHLGRFAAGGLMAIAMVIPVLVTSTVEAGATGTPTKLKLINSWTASPFGTNTPEVSVQSGVVTFEGAIAAPSTNTNVEPFKLPAQFRPAVNVYVPVDMCNATNGRLVIEPTGDVIVEEQDGMLAEADCFTSLDGVSFVQSSAVTPLTPTNGWSATGFGTANPAAASIKGVVHFQGAISATSPSSAAVFVLPPSLTPSAEVFVPVDMCDATNGRLDIATTGQVTVEEEDGGTSNENCFTSLDGASFVQTPKSPTLLTLKNGWTGQPFGTGSAIAELSNGVVTFGGAIANGTTAVASKLPSNMRPTHIVFVKVDLCDATNGRLEIKPTGKVLVEEEGGGLTNADCFTSLDGPSFVP
jgi:hypothetical protein